MEQQRVTGEEKVLVGRLFTFNQVDAHGHWVDADTVVTFEPDAPVYLIHSNNQVYGRLAALEKKEDGIYAVLQLNKKGAEIYQQFDDVFLSAGFLGSVREDGYIAYSHILEVSMTPQPAQKNTPLIPVLKNGIGDFQILGKPLKIEHMQQFIKKQDLNAIEAMVADQQLKISALEASVQDIAKKVDSLTSRLDAVEAQIQGSQEVMDQAQNVVEQTKAFLDTYAKNMGDLKDIGMTLVQIIKNLNKGDNYGNKA